jgi:hypothetical protein
VTGFLTVAAFFAGLAATMAALVWLARRVRRRGIGGGLMGPIDEMWHPSAHRFRLEIETHEQRMMPMSPAEDGDRRRGAPR